ncbi:MAG: proton-conducting transporter membrane subunit [Pseudomonadales bacterium]
MTAYAALPLWLVLTSLVAAALIFALGEARRRARTVVNLGAAALKLVLVGVILDGVAAGHLFSVRLPLMPGFDLVLRADALTMLLSTLSAVLWLITTVYAIGYLEHSPHRCRFFGFFSLCVAATTGVAVAGNLFTFFVFYELLTLATWPLVVHRGTAAALAAGDVYLRYTLGGGALLLLGVVGLHAVAGPGDFTAGGFVPVDAAPAWLLTLLFLVMFVGMGVKAAVVPMHGWLPRAMVAPAPVSALLHAVAVVKAGAFGIVRLTYDVYGLSLVAALGVGLAVAAVAALTILYGSLRALTATDLKQRLAWSTVSQVSYILLGVGLGNPLASVGGLVHLVHQGLMKITLFFCAGAFAEVAGVKRVDELDGMGRRMPLTMAAFTVAALGMIGLPPLAGFVSKWYLGLGGLAAGQPWVVAVLVASTLLNAAYFLPMLRRAWFNSDGGAVEVREAPLALLAPTLIAAALALGAGLLAAMPWSPLQWVTLIAERVYLLAPPS